MELIQQNINEDFTDFHTHILPAMDDGPKEAAVSVRMLCKLKEQGVSRVCLTPHYIHHREPVGDFINRRKESFEKLLLEIKKQGKEENVPELKLGAEVSLENGLLEEEKLRALCYENTDMILLEMPFVTPDEQTFYLIENIALKYKVRPVIAHLDRYVKFLNREKIGRILDIPDVIIQINSSATGFFGCRSFVKNLMKTGVPMVLGSDCHDEVRRPPKI
ncbi:MAG: capsular polysaccharide biosynthesis protein [Ruminococcaceae bacterium]|nr:capsular polysaccharide biosynthesis protein [Oscillospiraceae bacterium]